MDQGLAYMRQVKKAVRKEKDAEEAILSHRQEIAASCSHQQPDTSLQFASVPDENLSSDLEPPSLQVQLFVINARINSHGTV